MSNDVVEKRREGRPSKMDDPQYRSDIADTVITLGMQGMSKSQISARIDVDMRTMDGWSEKWPEFSDAVIRAKELEQAWWEDQAHQNLKNKNFNANLWLKSAIYRFPEYQRLTQQHKVEITGAEGGAIEVAVNHTMLMDTARRVMMILGDASSVLGDASNVIEAEVIEALPPPAKD